MDAQEDISYYNLTANIQRPTRQNEVKNDHLKQYYEVSLRRCRRI